MWWTWSDEASECIQLNTDRWFQKQIVKRNAELWYWKGLGCQDLDRGFTLKAKESAGSEVNNQVSYLALKWVKSILWQFSLWKSFKILVLMPKRLYQLCRELHK